MPSKYAEAYARLKSYRAVAREFGVTHQVVMRSIKGSADPTWEDIAERDGFDPSNGGWLKFPPREDKAPVASVRIPPREQTDDELEAKLEAFKARLPIYDPIPPPTGAWEADSADLIALFDTHIGMYAYRREGGAQWDVDEAQRLVPGAASLLMNRPVKPERLTLVFGGDWRHYERPDALTQYSGHMLSTDTRIGKVQRVAIQLKVTVCDLALTHYRHVEVIDGEGNHDPVSQRADREWLKIVYRNEPRIEVVDHDDLPFYARRVGGVFQGFHHGDVMPIKTPRDRLVVALRFAELYPEDWTLGTALRVIHSGHLHHKMAGWCEESGVWFEQHGTIAPRDGYAARKYAKSQRGLTRITYHGDGGEIGRESMPPVLVRRLVG